jgi:hypothetical protein
MQKPEIRKNIATAAEPLAIIDTMRQKEDAIGLPGTTGRFDAR